MGQQRAWGGMGLCERSPWRRGVRKYGHTLVFGIALAALLLPSLGWAQQFATQPGGPDRDWSWRAWMYSGAAAANDYAYDRDERPAGLGALLGRTFGDGIIASFRLRSTVDASGERRRSAFLVLTLPLSIPRESPVMPAAAGGTGWRLPAPSATVPPRVEERPADFVGGRLAERTAYARAFGIAPEAVAPADATRRPPAISPGLH